MAGERKGLFFFKYGIRVEVQVKTSRVLRVMPLAAVVPYCQQLKVLYVLCFFAYSKV